MIVQTFKDWNSSTKTENTAKKKKNTFLVGNLSTKLLMTELLKAVTKLSQKVVTRFSFVTLNCFFRIQNLKTCTQFEQMTLFQCEQNYSLTTRRIPCIQCTQNFSFLKTLTKSRIFVSTCRINLPGLVSKVYVIVCCHNRVMQAGSQTCVFV